MNIALRALPVDEGMTLTDNSSPQQVVAKLEGGFQEGYAAGIAHQDAEKQHLHEWLDAQGAPRDDDDGWVSCPLSLRGRVESLLARVTSNILAQQKVCATATDPRLSEADGDAQFHTRTLKRADPSSTR